LLGEVLLWETTNHMLVDDEPLVLDSLRELVAREKKDTT
jgi:hypothetical protein